jgi:xylulokinase
MHILGLDVGTSSVKAAVLDVATAQPLGPISHVHYDLDHPAPDAEEVPAERLWHAVADAARQAARGGSVAGVGLSVMTPALVLVGADDQPLAPIWTHLDRRSRMAARQTWGAVGPEFLATVGNRPLPGGISAVCFKQQLVQTPYLLHRVKRYLHVNGWLALRMTGDCAFDPANASFTGLFNTVTDQQWSRRWCDYFEVDPAWLPPVMDGAATVGTLRSAAAAELGVPPGVPVKLGTADTSCAMLAAGMTRDDLLHVVGTTQVLSVLADRPAPDPRRLTRLLGVGAGYVQVTHNPVGGAALDWLHRLCFREQSAEEFFHRTVAEAQQRTTRVALDPAYLGGDRLEIEAHRAAFRELTLETDRLDLLTAVLRALAEQHERALAALGPRTFRRVFLTGGGAEVVRRLIPAYAAADLHELEEGSLRGAAVFFRG